MPFEFRVVDLRAVRGDVQLLFVPRGADHQRDVRRVAVAHGLERVVGQRVAVDHGGERSARALCLQQLGDLDGAQPVGIGVGDAESLEVLGGDRRCEVGGAEPVGGAALGDRLVEQDVRGGHGEQCRHGDAAGGLAEDRDVARVAAEALDVVVDPLQRGDLVQLADVGGRTPGIAAVPAEIEVPERSDAVVDRHHDDVTPFGRAGRRRTRPAIPIRG